MLNLTFEMYEQPPNELPFDLSGGIWVVVVIEMRFRDGMCGMACVGCVKNRIPIHLGVGLAFEMFE